MSSIRLPAPSSNGGSARMPGDKSISHRALMLAAFARGDSELVNCNRGGDVAKTISALRKLGARVRCTGNVLVVQGTRAVRDPASTVDCGNSGTTMRLLMGLLAGRANVTLDGDASLRRRPMERAAAPLRSMRADISTSADGRPPVRIQRTRSALRGIDYRMPVASAQLKSALLLAGLRATGTTRVLSPLPCRDHTERMLAAMGAPIEFGPTSALIRAGDLHGLGRYEVPGDISAAVFFIVAAAMRPGFRLQVYDIGINPTRAAVFAALRAMGVQVNQRNRRDRQGEPLADLEIVGGAPVCAIEIAAPAVPNLIDELPALCALAACAKGTFSIRGARELRFKESDRIVRTVALLRDFGADAAETSDGIIVRGGRPLRAPRRISTGGDHRIGMTAAALATAAGSPLVIDDAACIATSFPDFAQSWLGAFA